MKLWIGTSGFQYPEWKGTFYPETMPTAKMLPYYAERFSATEVNYTFRQIPSTKTMERWSSLTPEEFRFSLKAPQKVTHFAKLRECADTLRYFHQVTSQLGAKLGPVLFQLPGSFKKDAPRLAAFLEEVPNGMRIAFEFRDASWFDEEVFGLLRQWNVALCIAESANLATPVEATANFGYLRLRREDYDAASLAKWADIIRAKATQWGDLFVFFKHEESGVGPKFASEMKQLLA
ncbi:MAG: DUF72 domain-containing protein [Chthoniobacterales bacterium]